VYSGDDDDDNDDDELLHTEQHLLNTELNRSFRDMYCVIILSYLTVHHEYLHVSHPSTVYVTDM